MISSESSAFSTAKANGLRTCPPRPFLSLNVFPSILRNTGPSSPIVGRRDTDTITFVFADLPIDGSITVPNLAPDVLALIDFKVPSYGRYRLEQYITPPRAVNAANLGAVMQTALDDRAMGGAMAGKPLVVPAQKIDMTDAWVYPPAIKVYWGGRLRPSSATAIQQGRRASRTHMPGH